ncbi:MAG: FHA domain-containing protein [Planctomycetaceae bacterium]
MSQDNFRISADELYSSKVEEVLEAQAYLSRDVGEVEQLSWIQKALYSSWMYLAFWGMVGGLIGWGCLEPFFDDNEFAEESGSTLVAALLMFPVVAGCVGLFLGAAEGVMCRNTLRAVKSGAVGLGVGFVGGLVALIPTGIVFSIMTNIAISFDDHRGMEGMPTGMAFLILMMGRAMAWAIIAIPAGIGQGIAIKERKVVLNGLLGAVMGGFIGGMAFDPISVALVTEDGQATYSRGVGFAVIGCVVGLLIGLVEGWTKNAWLLMRKGPLAGKQFVMFKDTTVLGSSPKAEIYLFKDDAIEPKHAVIYNRGGRFEIEDCGTPDGTYVNGVAIKRTYLKPGDQIVLGKTVLEFALRESRT